jgi:mannose-1-phosphate guanylyltransferase
LWEVIEKGKGYKVKKLTIEPNQAISLQWHEHRSETWCIVGGEGIVKLGEKTFEVKAGDTFVVPVGRLHKVTAHETGLVAIEVQLGEITEESDIKRPPQ